jgi:hypothetical protein
MLTCVQCNQPITQEQKVTYVRPNLWEHSDEPIKYLHYVKCADEYYSTHREEHINSRILRMRRSNV